jgi:hypothetical protein
MVTITEQGKIPTQNIAPDVTERKRWKNYNPERMPPRRVISKGLSIGY